MPLILRYLGMIASWVAFPLAFTVLFLGMRAVIAVGGYCAEGGPYVIATPCPGNVGLLMPASVFIGLAAVGVNLYLARGLGASLSLLAWPILFIGLSLNFLQAGLTPDSMGGTGLFLGIMFFVMGVVPLIAWLRQPGNPAAAVAGTSHLDGTLAGRVSFAWGRSAHPGPPGALTPLDFVVLVPLWLLAALVGVVLGVIWMSA